MGRNYMKKQLMGQGKVNPKLKLFSDQNSKNRSELN